ncbi:MAG: hypothetical protein ABEI96_10635 [Haloarculaceae archaeon]
MNDVLDFEDTLEPLGIGVGVLLVLVGIATIAGGPWGIKSAAAAGLQIVGALGTIAVGAILVWISRS